MRNGMRNQLVALAFGIALLGMIYPASAGLIAIITPIGATASNQINGTDTPAQTINGSGLAFTVPASIDSVADLPKHNEDPNNIPTSFNGGMWLTGAAPGTVTITYDLGSVQKVDTLIIWNYAEEPFANTSPLDSSNRGAKNVTLLADNNPTPTTTIQSFVFTQAVIPGGTTANVSATPFFNEDFNAAANIYTLTSPVTARYFEFSISTDYGAASGYIGLSEVRFGDTPEPSSLAGMLILGLAAMARTRRVRRA